VGPGKSQGQKMRCVIFFVSCGSFALSRALAGHRPGAGGSLKRGASAQARYLVGS
jgi:hypothetical protein